MNSRIQNIDKEASTLFTKVVATARQQNSARTNLVRHVAIIQMSIRCPQTTVLFPDSTYSFYRKWGRIIQTHQHID